MKGGGGNGSEPGFGVVSSSIKIAHIANNCMSGLTCLPRLDITTLVDWA